MENKSSQHTLRQKFTCFCHKHAPLLLAAGLGIVCAYELTAAYFETHLFPNTTLNGTDCSFLRKEEAEELLQQKVKDYSITLNEKQGKTEIITGPSLSLTYSPADEVADVLSHQCEFLWPAAIFQKQERQITMDIRFDDQQFADVLQKLSCTDDAMQLISLNARPRLENGKYEIEPEIIGTTLDHARFEAVLTDAIHNLLPKLDLEQADVYAYPAILSDDKALTDGVDLMNRWILAEITYRFPMDTIKESIDSELISQWISFDEKKKKAVLDEDKITAYVSELADTYDVPDTEREFVTATGNVVTISGGNSCWLMDQEKEVTKIMDNIRHSAKVTREPVWASSEGIYENSGLGTTYAEVDLTNQRMYFIQNNRVVLESDVVTGNPRKGNATPPGVFSVTYKRRNAVLRGQRRKDGSYTYESPVKYWMPFNRGIGFHDASWQSSFGGTRYLTRGSHGCVNMPRKNAAKLYELIEQGTTVVVYK